MKEKVWQFFKATVFVCFVITLQIAVLKEFSTLGFNLPLVSIIAISSFVNLEISIYSASLSIVLINLLSYNNSFYWSYLIVAILVNQLNPKNLEDKFLIALFYCVILSPIFELIYTPLHENLINKCITSTLINLATIIPLYFILKIFFIEKPKGYYYQ